MLGFWYQKSMAHRSVDAVIGTSTIQHGTVVSEDAVALTTISFGALDACNVHSKAFQDCVNNFRSDISKCQFYIDMLAECRKNYGLMIVLFG
ncbi:hypothetical protein JRO89_XS06G0258800 [Xanthoceras sorbifolium]|uniref:CHCH domain-containing protein n=1 Tax=Xanthoceras sorbifolium TaxID=99658 RepID=A0ABQ8HZX5_9ROSI|nr:hypothetical protein JRO89_XS06G0258800 [Xanthoceras sorbifolium]